MIPQVGDTWSEITPEGQVKGYYKIESVHKYFAMATKLGKKRRASQRIWLKHFGNRYVKTGT